ncbi:hypothetical protein CRG98_029548 [Punica granatum]|uniref:RNase H type-1 domain-containing protein n=1 Tax=Punica granatum TaxID=22663 RepID=A0A2I0J1D2_PUNGR|nr:hypothetical protein CRG98_029548 [Punica granatum]
MAGVSSGSWLTSFPRRGLRRLERPLTNDLIREGIGDRRSPKVWKWIRWARPQQGWVKVNPDGSSSGNPGLAGASGVIRGEDGNGLTSLSTMSDSRLQSSPNYGGPS